MPKCRLLCCSEVAIVDKFTNDLTIINVLDTIQATSFPQWHGELVVSAVIVRMPNEASEVELNLVLSKGRKPLQSFPFVADFGEMLRHTAIIRMHGIGIQGPGELVLALKHGAKTLASFSIDVTAMSKSASASGASD